MMTIVILIIVFKNIAIFYCFLKHALDNLNPKQFLTENRIKNCPKISKNFVFKKTTPRKKKLIIPSGFCLEIK